VSCRAPPRWHLTGGLLVLALAFAAPARAHHDPLSRSEWRLLPEDGAVGATLMFQLSDVMPVLLAGARVPALNPVAQREAFDRVIRDTAPGFIHVAADGATCRARVLRVQYAKGVEIGFAFDCARGAKALELHLAVLDRLPANHQHLASIRVGNERVTAELRRDASRWSWRATANAAEASAAPASDEPALPLGAAFRLGLHHVLIGLDHVLFVVALVLGARRLRDVLAATLAFTVAHSVTLGLAAYGIVDVPPEIAEPLIALSVVVAGLAALRQRPPPLPALVATVSAFGLVHGLGFAGGLTELALDRGLVQALLGFNLGVEAAQLLVAGATGAVVMSARRRAWYRRGVLVPASIAIAALGAFWAVERLLGS